MGIKKEKTPCKQGFSPRHFFIKSDVLIWQMTLIMIQVNPPLALGGSFCVKGVHSPANGNRTMLIERGGCITQYAMVK
mgnify:CR=1 FL=1